MRILFIGDIVGHPGRQAIKSWTSILRDEYQADIVVANGENAAGGLGITPEILAELSDAGVEAFTLGNHTWRKKVLISRIDDYDNVIRPANYPSGVPGRGSALITLADGRSLGLVNLLGRVYLDSFDCPFQAGEREVAALHARNATAILVDMHAEATSEKVAMGWYLDGQCTAVVGTHTHIQTADERLLHKGTAYITDVGMTGPRDSAIGVEREPVIRRFLTGLPEDFKVAKSEPWLCGVLIESDDTTGKAISIERVQRIGLP